MIDWVTAKIPLGPPHTGGNHFAQYRSDRLAPLAPAHRGNPHLEEGLDQPFPLAPAHRGKPRCFATTAFSCAASPRTQGETGISLSL
jgi:hypothetical protein